MRFLMISALRGPVATLLAALRLVCIKAGLSRLGSGFLDDHARLSRRRAMAVLIISLLSAVSGSTVSGSAAGFDSDLESDLLGSPPMQFACRQPSSNGCDLEFDV